MKLVRASWLIALAVIIVTAAVPSLRQQFRLGLRFAIPGRDMMQIYDGAIEKLVKPYEEQPVAFVEKHYPKDAQMLLGAAIVADDTEVLKRAAETANSPVAWAAYVERLMQTQPAFERIGSWGVDPADAEAVAEAEKEIAESGLPDHLTAEQTEPILSALRSWEEADPANALPVALEMRVLYGLHRDRDALSTWAQAGRMPIVTSHPLERAEALRRFFVARGMPEPEALLSSQVTLSFPSFARLRDAARIAVYEGRLADLHDDPIAAVTWWQSTADLGIHMQESAESMIGYLVGVAVEGIGAAPVWLWRPDRATGIPGGPLLDGRYFWGDDHALYVAHMGKANDEALLDSLVLAKLRSQEIREYNREGLGMFDAYFVAGRYLGLVIWAAALAIFLFLVYLIFGTWFRRAADSATNLHAFWQIVLAAVFLAPLIVASAILLRVPVSKPTPPASAESAVIWCGIAFVLALLVLPPLAAIGSRVPGSRLRTAWRGNLRRLLPVSIALFALLCLGLNVYALHLRSQWVAKWTAPGVTEMGNMVEELGARWASPAIPPDTYRAEYPPTPAGS